MRHMTQVIADAIDAHTVKAADRNGRTGIWLIACQCGFEFEGNVLELTLSAHREHRAESVRQAIVTKAEPWHDVTARPFMTVQHLTSH